MGPVRSIITRLVFLVTALITVVSVWQAGQQDLTVDLDRRHIELFDQLASIDVAQSSADERLQLLQQLDRAFRLGADWQEPLLELDEPAWKQFRENLFALLHEWLIVRADEYHEIGQGGGHVGGRQKRFVDRQVDTATAWIAAAPKRNSPDGSSRGPQGQLAAFELIGRVQQWTNEAEGDEREQLESFTRAIVARAAERHREMISAPGA